MPRRKLKNTADSTMSFRISSAEKKKIETQLEKLRASFNSQVSDKEYKATKNEIIYSALKRGLKGLSLQDLPKRNKKLQTPGG